MQNSFHSCATFHRDKGPVRNLVRGIELHIEYGSRNHPFIIMNEAERQLLRSTSGAPARRGGGKLSLRPDGRSTLR